MACNPALLKPIGMDTRAVVAGAGRSGRAAARLLRFLRASVRVLERNPENISRDFAEWAAQAGVELISGEHRPEHFLDADVLVPSPGVAAATLLPLLPPRKTPDILAETELAWRQLEGEPVLAVTGTSGKTTTTSLCAAMLRAQGLETFTGGNIGVPLSEYVLARHAASPVPKADALVLELSSFQLQTIESFRPRVAVLLNISENHLDYHKDMREYLEAKMRLFRCQQSGDLAVFAPELKGLSERFRAQARCAYFDRTKRRFPVIRLLGGHNQANAEAAWQACREFGVSESVAAGVVAEFQPLPHRLESIAEQDGVLFVNDSKCTTAEALRMALQAFDRPVLLMAGGKFKGGDLGGLAGLLRSHVKAAALFGASREIFEAAWKNVLPLTWDPTLREALARLRDLAAPGDVILLAPATSSYDQYPDYTRRGDDFRQAVLEAAHRRENPA